MSRFAGVDVDVDVAGEPAVLVADHRGPFEEPDVGELRERDLRPRHRRNERAGELVGVVAELPRVADVDRVALAPLDRRRDVLAADRRHDDFLDFPDRQAVAGDLPPLQVEVDEVAAGDALAVDAARSRDVLRAICSSCSPIRSISVEIGAEDLDAHRRADARRQHVDAVLDRHRPGVRLAGKLQRRVHLVDEVVPRDRLGPERADDRLEEPGNPLRVPALLRPPLRLGLQDDDRLHHREGRRVGRGLGAPGLAEDALDLGKLPQDPVLPLQEILRRRSRRCRAASSACTGSSLRSRAA